VIGVCALTGFAGDEASTLDVDQTKSLTVQITGPDILVTRAAGQSLGIPFGGCGYSIDWGDGAVSPQDFTQGPPYCEADLTHQYATPGDYMVTVKTWDTGPADELINQVKIDAKITVE